MKTKNDLKMKISMLLALESVSGIIACVFFVCILAVEKGVADDFQVWFVGFSSYFISGIILFYGLWLRPMRKKLIEKLFAYPRFTSSGKKLQILEAIFAILLFGLWYVDFNLIYLVIFAIYSLWKISEFAVDRGRFAKKGGYNI